MTSEPLRCRPSPDLKWPLCCGHPLRVALSHLSMEMSLSRAVTSTGFRTDGPCLGPLRSLRGPCLASARGRK